MLIFLAAAGFSVRYCPAFKGVERDSGVFLYSASQLLEGKLPYKDFWDHKPPLIYIFNAIGLSLGMGVWGVWLLETLLFAVACVVLYMAVARSLGIVPAVVCSASIILLSRKWELFLGGNFTEGYCMAFAMLILAGLASKKQADWKWLLMGVAAGTIFFTKQSCIGIPAAVGIVATLNAIARGKWQYWRYLLSYCVGGILLVIVIIAALAATGILAEFWDANITFNRIYLQSRVANLNLMTQIYDSIYEFEAIGFVGILGFSFLACVLSLLANRFLSDNSIQKTLIWAVLISLPIECWFIAVPYRFYGHYFLTLCPLIGLAMAFWARLSLDWIRRFEGEEKPVLITSAISFLVIIVPFLSYSGPLTFQRQIKHALQPLQWNQSVHDNSEILVYLQNKGGEAKLMVWGAETTLNYRSGRVSPTRYSYMYPLTAEKYDQESRFKELLTSLNHHPQALIIDTLTDSPNRLGPPPAGLPRSVGVDKAIAWVKIPEELIDQLRDYIALNYEIDRTFNNGWIAYTPKTREFLTKKDNDSSKQQ